MPDSLDYIRRAYKVDVQVGSKLVWRGRPATVVRGSNYVWFVYDDDRKQVEYPIHPCEKGLVYTGEVGPLPKLSPGRRRYREYKRLTESWYDLTFKEFLTLPQFAEYRRA